MNLVDLHIHGAHGIDVQDTDALGAARLEEALGRRGVGAFLPTFVPAPLPELERALDVWVPRIEAAVGRRFEGTARPAGVHFEGPFVSPRRPGALPSAHLLDARDERTVTRFLDLLRGVPGRIVVTLAPEIPGGLDLVGALAREGHLAAIGHTDAETETVERALERGARHFTHLCNAMRPFHHRSPGPIGVALTAPDTTFELIADGVHLHPRTLRLAFAARAEAAVLVSDAIAPAGLGDGAFAALGGRVEVRGARAERPDGTLAGSVTLLDEALERAIACGVDEEAARRAASATPRRLLAAFA